MFAFHGQSRRQFVAAVALGLLTACGAPSTASPAPGSGSGAGTTPAPAAVAVTTPSAALRVATNTERATMATTVSPSTTQAANTVPGASDSVPQKLTFTGDLSGAFAMTPPPDVCGTRDQTVDGKLYHTFDVKGFRGTINSETYLLGFSIIHYHGPDTYKNAVVSLASFGPQDELLGDGDVVVTAGETSGTIDSDIKNTPFTKKVTAHVSGTWRCR